MKNIHIVTVNTATLPPHHATNCYIIGGDGEAVLIDPIYSRGGIIADCLDKNRIRSIRYAAVTHPHSDHYAGLDSLMATFGGAVACHRNAADALAEEVSGAAVHPWSGGETIETAGYAVEVMHTPGHSPAHLSFYIESEGILFSGDTVLGYGTSIISPPEGDMAAYMQTLHALAALDIRTICPAHGPVIREGARERMQWYVAHRMMRETRVLEALRDGLSTLPEITRRIYNEEDFKMHGVDLLPRAERSVLAHLEKLVREGVIFRKSGAPGIRYYLF